MRYVVNRCTDPAYNLSFEEYLFKYLPLEGEEYVCLWQNDRSVLIGRNQNADAEINAEYVREHNIHVVRRITGGGAVYHDLGNLNFSFITKTKGHDRIDFRRYYVPIVSALQSLGLPAELSGRNDITVDGKKCVGASQSVYRDRVLSNGCILFDVELDALSRALHVRKEKLQSKGVASVRARVTNLRPYLQGAPDVQAFQSILLREIFRQAGEAPTEYCLSPQDLEGIQKIYRERFSRPSWNLGRRPRGAHRYYRRFPAGFVETSFDVVDDRMLHVAIHGDFFGKEDVEDIAQALEGVSYAESAVREVLLRFPLQAYFGEVETEDLMTVFFPEATERDDHRTSTE